MKRVEAITTIRLKVDFPAEDGDSTGVISEMIIDAVKDQLRRITPLSQLNSNESRIRLLDVDVGLPFKPVRGEPYVIRWRSVAGSWIDYHEEKEIQKALAIARGLVKTHKVVAVFQKDVLVEKLST